jgi:hypothetical protein
MLERFTDRARKVMQFAGQQAEWLRHDSLRSEHIVLGLVKEGEGVAAKALKNLGVDLRIVRLAIEKLGLDRAETISRNDLRWSSEVVRLVVYSLEEARNLGRDYVDTEHILLALLRKHGGAAARVLAQLGLKAEDVRNEARATLQRAREGAQTPDKQTKTFDEPPGKCPRCGQSHVVRVLPCDARLNWIDREDVDAGKAILGPRSGDGPSWVCLTCVPAWSDVHHMAMKDRQWECAREGAVAANDFETAAEIRDAQADLRRRLHALVRELSSNR